MPGNSTVTDVLPTPASFTAASVRNHRKARGNCKVPVKAMCHRSRRFRMQVRSSARQLWRSMTATATACGYCRFLSCCGDIPSRSSRLSSTCNSSIKTLKRVDDHASDFVVETTERKTCGRTACRQRLTAASFPVTATRLLLERFLLEASVDLPVRRRDIAAPEGSLVASDLFTVSKIASAGRNTKKSQAIPANPDRLHGHLAGIRCQEIKIGLEMRQR